MLRARMLAPRHALALVALLVALRPAPAAAESCACDAPMSEASLMSEASTEAMMSAFFVGDAGLASDPGAWPLYEPLAEPSVLLAAHHAASLPLSELASFMPSLSGAPLLEAGEGPEPAERPAWCEGPGDPRCQAPPPASAAGELSVGPLALPPASVGAPSLPPSAQTLRATSLVSAASGRGTRVDRPPRV